MSPREFAEQFTRYCVRTTVSRGDEKMLVQWLSQRDEDALFVAAMCALLQRLSTREVA